MRDPNVTHLIWIIVATLGGVARTLNEFLVTGAPIAFGKFFAGAFVSGFSGWMFAQTLSLHEPNLSIAVAGVGGYMGAQALELLVTRFSRK